MIASITIKGLIDADIVQCRASIALSPWDMEFFCKLPKVQLMGSLEKSTINRADGNDGVVLCSVMCTAKITKFACLGNVRQKQYDHLDVTRPDCMCKHVLYKIMKQPS